MDYKGRLDELVSQQTRKHEAEGHRKKSFEGQQKAAFAKVRQSIIDIIEAAGPTISLNYVYDRSAEIMIRGAYGRQTTYRLEPNSRGKYSSSPAPAPGYVVETEIKYKNEAQYAEPTTREYVLKDEHEVFEDLMKLIAEAIADKNC